MFTTCWDRSICCWSLIQTCPDLHLVKHIIVEVLVAQLHSNHQHWLGQLDLKPGVDQVRSAEHSLLLINWWDQVIYQELISPHRRSLTMNLCRLSRLI